MSTRTHPRPRPRWERIALVASLAVNLAVAGVVAGQALRGPAPERDRVFLPIEGMRHIHRALPAEERAALIEPLSDDEATVDALMEVVRANFG